MFPSPITDLEASLFGSVKVIVVLVEMGEQLVLRSSGMATTYYHIFQDSKILELKNT